MLSLPASVRAQDRITRFEQGVFEVSAASLPPITLLVLVDSAGTPFLPVGAVAEHLGFELQRGEREWRLPRLRGAGVLLLDSRALALGEDTLRLGTAEFVLSEGEIFLPAARLASLLEGTATVDFGRLNVHFERDPLFPAQQRIELERRRAVLRGRDDDARLDRRFGSTRHTGFGTVDWDVSTNGLDPTRLLFLRTNVGASVLGGGLTVGGTLQAGRDAAERLRDRAIRYQRVFALPWLGQLQAGDIITQGLYGRFVTGIEITNAPFMQDFDLGDVLLQPELPAGWQYEVLQGQQLLGYSEPGATRAVAVPLRTGATPIEVRMYGPAGEEVIERLTYQTPVTLLRRGTLQYVLGAGRCQDSSCNAYAHADARWAAASRLTVGAGGEIFNDTLETAGRPYALASFTTGTMLTGEVQAMPGAAYRASLFAYPIERLSARLDAALARPGYRRIAALAAAGYRWDVDFNVDRQLERTVLGVRTLRLSAGALGQRGEPADRVRLGLMGSSPIGFTELRLDRARFEPDLLAVRAARTVQVRVRGSALHPSMTGGLAFTRAGVDHFEAGTIVQPLPNAVLSASLLWSRRGGAGFSIAWNSRIGPMQALFRSAAARDADPTSALALSGSVAFAPPGVHPEAVSRTGYGGAYGTVFLDVDGDGLRGALEPTVPDLPLQIGTQLVTTDSTGRFAAWGLFPWIRAPIAVDSLRIPDPSWTLARARLEVVPAPNAAARIDVPLVQTRELAGSLVAVAPLATTAGITIHITNLDSGDVLSAVTFSDGTFYVSRLRPGRYRLAVAPAALLALRAAEPAPVDFTLDARSDAAFLELPPIQLRAR